MDSGLTAARRAFVERLREENERKYGGARAALEHMLSAGFSHKWMYVYELTQNARDAGARRVRWRLTPDAVIFEHDGADALDERSVAALSSLGQSTKGLAQVGFMGIGFKSVFARFRSARVSGFGWRLRFDIGEQVGDLDVRVTTLTDALLPRWDEELEEPADGYTTRFRLEGGDSAAVASDLQRLADDSDPTPLAVLALRGLEEITLGELTWTLRTTENDVTVVRDEETAFSWRVFRTHYEPTEPARRAFLQARRRLREDAGSGGRSRREVVALLPLDAAGNPDPPVAGRAYATLPTGVSVPFGLHVQADWLVDLDRQDLRDIENDAWQEDIVAQLPGLVGQALTWVASLPEDRAHRGYDLVTNPTQARFEGVSSAAIAAACERLRDSFAAALRGRSLFPTFGAEGRQLSALDAVRRLPAGFRLPFRGRRDFQPALLFDSRVLDEASLGERATSFVEWLGAGSELSLADAHWPSALERWWEAIDVGLRTDAMFALWLAVREEGWNRAPVVRTEAGTWVDASEIQWLDEEPPSEKEENGRAVHQEIVADLPAPSQRLAPDIRARVNQARRAPISGSAEGLAADWLKRHSTQRSLGDIIRRRFAEGPVKDETSYVYLLGWAMRAQREDLVPRVLTEAGPKPPTDALLADPLVARGGSDRRSLFGHLPALSDLYTLLDDQAQVVSFLRRLGVRGHGRPVERSERTRDVSVVATQLGLDVAQIGRANAGGYTIVDRCFEINIDAADPKALQRWLTLEVTELARTGHRVARWHFHREQVGRGERVCSWVDDLQRTAWVLCKDGVRRKPGEVLLKVNADFEDAPLADIDSQLARCLLGEGVQFGHEIPKAHVIRRMIGSGSAQRSEDEIAQLLEEARAACEAGEISVEELNHALGGVRIANRPLERVVEQVSRGIGGPRGARADLQWVIALADLAPQLQNAIRQLTLVPGLTLAIPATTTGWHALAFLRDVWRRRPTTSDEPRRQAQAYRYVLEDAERDCALHEAWQSAIAQAVVYANRDWHPLGPELLVEDVQSPQLRKLVNKAKLVVVPSYLGEDPDEVRRVAEALGIPLLSRTVEVVAGKDRDEPAYAARLRRLINVLESLEGRAALPGISFCADIKVRVGSAEPVNIAAFIRDGEMLFAGTPTGFAADAALQLVGHFQLGHAGQACTLLSLALANLDAPSRFKAYLGSLADVLNVDLAQIAEVRPAQTNGTETVDPQPVNTPDTPHEPHTLDGDVAAIPESESTTYEAEGSALGTGGKDQYQPEAPDISPAKAWPPEASAESDGMNEGAEADVLEHASSDRVPEVVGDAWDDDEENNAEDDENDHPVDQEERTRQRPRPFGAPGWQQRQPSSRGNLHLPRTSDAKAHDGSLPWSSGASSTPSNSNGRVRSAQTQAADHFRILEISLGSHEPRASEDGVHHEPRNDERARAAVARYERERGRRPEVLAELNPGYDVLSVDEATETCRRIEIKGVAGHFEGDASVVLTARQARDALEHDGDETQYWLYVVEGTETERPRVIPIRWMRFKDRLRYGFYARGWLRDAEEPAEVSVEVLDDEADRDEVVFVGKG